MTPLIPGGDFFCAVEQCLLSSTRESALDRIFTRGTCGLEQVVALVRAKTEGDATELVISGESPEWRFTLAVKRLTSFNWEDDGTLAEAFDNDEVEQIYAAANNANLDQLLSALLVVLEGVEVEVEATWRNQFDKLNAHYLETVDLFTARASGDEWHVFVRELTSGIPALMVGDLEGSLQCKHFQVFGPGGSATLATPESGLDVGAHADTRPRLPTPNTFALLDYTVGIPSRDRLALALNGLTRALTWYWIANSVQVKKSILTLYFTGSRVVEIGNFRPTSTTAVEYDVRLAEWAFSASDPARLEAVRRAASTVLSDNDTLANVAAPVLRTAESLYEIARRDVVAEALATRRTARQAVLAAANEAAKSAREASAKVTERSIVQIAASVGILVANAKDLINLPISLVVIGVILAAVVVSWRVSKAMDLTATRVTLDNFVKDLDEYRDTLSEADIEQLRGLHSIATARHHLDQSERIAQRMVTGVATLLVAAASFIIWLAVARAQPEEGLPPYSPKTSVPGTATTTTTTTAPTGASPPTSSRVPASGI